MFPTTRHTLLEHASGQGERRGPALNTFIEVYWEPCRRYVMVRFRQSHEDAEDLVQGFFTAVVEQEILVRYDPVRGPFRPYLRACLDHFIGKCAAQRSAEKRGGGAALIPVNAEIIAAEDDPEQIFHREWQRRMFALATEDLRRLCDNTGRIVRYRIFAAYDLADEPRPRYEDLAREHAIPVSTVTNHLAWARRELRRLLVARIAAAAPAESDRSRDLRSLVRGRA